jgi:hypothetical protein
MKKKFREIGNGAGLVHGEEAKILFTPDSSMAKNTI